MAAKKENGPSYRVLSEDYVYRGQPALHGIKHLSPAEIVSMRPRYKIGAFSFGQNEAPLYNFDGNKVVFRTPNNVFEASREDFGKYGNFFGNDDFGMEGWLAAGEKVKPIMFDEVPALPQLPGQSGHHHPEGLWLGVPLRMYLPDSRDTPVNLYTRSTWVNVPINKVGIYLSKAANAELYFRNALLDTREMRRGDFNPEMAAWLEYLGSRGFRNPGELIEIGVQKDDFYAATYPGRHVALVLPDDFEEKVDGIMRSYSLEGSRARQLVIDQIIFHELNHFFPKGYKGYDFLRWRIEGRAGKLQADFYGKRAKLLEGKDAAGIYKVLEQIDRDYARSWSLRNVVLHGLLRGKSGSRESLESRLEAEAASLGLKGDAIAAYVGMMMDDYDAREAAEEGAKPEKSGRKGGLESRVEALSASAKSKGKSSRQNGREAAIYEKGQVYGAKENAESREAEEESAGKESDSADSENGNETGEGKDEGGSEE